MMRAKLAAGTGFLGSRRAEGVARTAAGVGPGTTAGDSGTNPISGA
jgi:hypothetical protein